MSTYEVKPITNFIDWNYAVRNGSFERFKDLVERLRGNVQREELEGIVGEINKITQHNSEVDFVAEINYTDGEIEMWAKNRVAAYYTDVVWRNIAKLKKVE